MKQRKNQIKLGLKKTEKNCNANIRKFCKYVRGLNNLADVKAQYKCSKTQTHTSYKFRIKKLKKENDIYYV